MKHNKTFHKLFPELPETEDLLHGERLVHVCSLRCVCDVWDTIAAASRVFNAVFAAYICALQKEVPYHGRLYITDSSLCFFSSVLLKDTKVRSVRSARTRSEQWSKPRLTDSCVCVCQVIVPVSSVNVLKKQNTALLVPNAISVRTTDGEKVSLKHLNTFTLLSTLSSEQWKNHLCWLMQINKYWGFLFVFYPFFFFFVKRTD